MISKKCFIGIVLLLAAACGWAQETPSAQAFYAKNILNPCIQNKYTTFTLRVENSNDKADGLLAREYIIYRMPKGKVVRSLTADNDWYFAKYAYHYVADPENYFQVASLFKFASNKTELLNYIKSGR